MGIFDTVNDQLKEAMRTQNKARLAGLRGIRAGLITEMKKDNSNTLPDEKCLGVLKSLAKQRHDSIDAYKGAGREDLVAQESAELAVIEEFLPKQADASTSRQWVKDAIQAAGATSAKDMGKVMAELMKAHKGEIDGKLAKDLAAELLG